MTWPPRNKCADEKRPYAEGEEEEGGEEEARAQPLKSTKGAGAWGGGVGDAGVSPPCGFSLVPFGTGQTPGPRRQINALAPSVRGPVHEGSCGSELGARSKTQNHVRNTSPCCL